MFKLTTMSIRFTDRSFISKVNTTVITLVSVVKNYSLSSLFTSPLRKPQNEEWQTVLKPKKRASQYSQLNTEKIQTNLEAKD